MKKIIIGTVAAVALAGAVYATCYNCCGGADSCSTTAMCQTDSKCCEEKK